jgi:hypothetical protein
MRNAEFLRIGICTSDFFQIRAKEGALAELLHFLGLDLLRLLSMQKPRLEIDSVSRRIRQSPLWVVSEALAPR